MKNNPKQTKQDEQTISPAPTGWPDPLSSSAMHGIVGQIISTIGPQSEADPAALAVGILTAFGNAIGPEPGFRVETTRHALNLFAVFVGETGKARKGTASDIVRSIFGQADRDWCDGRIRSGLSSGEGLIAAAAKDSDPRLFFLEEEFTRVLRVMGRPTSTLSTITRCAWDGKPLEIQTKTDPVIVRGHHIGLLGHTTIEDLHRYLTTTDVVNGFLNRDLLVCVRRSKLLPFGGSVPAADLQRLVRQIKSALKFASSCREIGFSAKAAVLWSRKYPELTADRAGLFGAATSRAEAQTRRIAAIYALMDESDQVLIQHLKAALEIWRYCEQSARFIFGQRDPRPIDAEILELLQRTQKKGVTLTEISAAFSRHRKRFEIGAALERLKKSGKATCQKVATSGRAAQRWFSAKS